MLPATFLLGLAVATATLAAPTVQSIPAIAAPSPFSTSRFKVANTGSKSAYQFENGTINHAYLLAESANLLVKFAKFKSNTFVALPAARKVQAQESEATKKRAKKSKAKIVKHRGDKKNSTTTRHQKRAANEVDLINQAQIEYDAPLTLGTPSQELLINLDTGSSDLWVATQHTIGALTTFNTAESTTYQGSSTPFSIAYGSGAVLGTLACDTVTLGGYTASKQYFGAVKAISTNFINGPSAGILGMAFQALAASKKTPFFVNIVNQGVLAANMFGFYLTRNSAVGSNVVLGGVDKSKFVGPIMYTPVTYQAFWQVASKVLVNDAVIGAVGGAMDTATTFMYYPTALTRQIYAAIPGATPDTVDDAFVAGGSDYYQYPCANNFTVSLSFAGINQTFLISADDFNIGVSSSDAKQCIGAIIGMDINDPQGKPIAIIGGSFLKNYYSVYNFNGTADGLPAVGLAQLSPNLS